MDEKLDKIIDKLHEIDVKVERNTVVLGKNADDIAEHIRRTDLLETYIKKREEVVEGQLTEALKPVNWIRITVKVIAGLSVTVGLVLGIIKLLGYI